MEHLEYKVMAWPDDLAQMLKQLDELGAQGWEVCAQGYTRTGRVVIGRVNPQPESHMLLLKRHVEA
jgi:hypothetical protein